ncbi:MAG TPA: hypothetical protein VNK52_10045 [Hyphomicrobiaceae bacterium]|nr:hypothetical protein [Hyphomicrobiaceae bacterium]
MFGWFKRRSTPPLSQKDRQLVLEAAPTADRATLRGGPAVVPVVPAETEAVAVTAAPSRARGRDVRRSSARPPGRLSLPPEDYKEPAPAAGMIAVEIAAPRVRRAVVTRVFAGGRRVMARIGDSARGCWYARGADGTYRLEGAPRGKAPRLVIGLDPTQTR